jgi:hypothetical protein
MATFTMPKMIKPLKVKSPKALKAGGLNIKMPKLTTKAKKKATIKSILRGFAK